MKTFQVDPMSRIPTIRVKIGDTVTVFTFATKKQADKKIMKLIAAGYKFDSQHPK